MYWEMGRADYGWAEEVDGREGGALDVVDICSRGDEQYVLLHSIVNFIDNF